MITRRSLLSRIPPLSVAATSKLPALGLLAAATHGAKAASLPAGLTLLPGVPIEQTRTAAESLRFNTRRLPFIVYPNESDIVELALDSIVNESISNNTEQFSMLFFTRSLVVLEEDTYPVEHADLGSFILHLTPAGEINTGRYYKAMVVHLRNSSTSSTSAPARLGAY